MPTYKDPEWIQAKKECDGTVQLSKDDRNCLLMEMTPTDDEMDASDEG